MLYLEKIYYELQKKHPNNELFHQNFQYYISHYTDEIIGIYQKYLDFFHENENEYILSVITELFNPNKKQLMIDFFLNDQHYQVLGIENSLHFSLNFEQTLFMNQILHGEVFSYYKSDILVQKKLLYFS